MNTSHLLDLYHRTSKHSNYQVLPTAVASLLGEGAVAVRSRFEHERLAYILSRVPVGGLHMADIGGNTGFFSFELLAHGAGRLDYFEGNQAHHDFVRSAVQRLGLAERLHTHHGYVTFDLAEFPQVDCTLLLNVLHHLGDDFGAAGTREQAKQRMLDHLSMVARKSRLLVLQQGFNWKGDRHQPLLPGGTKAEMIDFIQQGTASDWEITAIGIAERDGDQIVFKDLSDRNIARDDSLGEFLNRPLFIMRSRHPLIDSPLSIASDKNFLK